MPFFRPVSAGGAVPKATVTGSTGSPTIDTTSRPGKTIYKFTGSGSLTVGTAGSCEVLTVGGGGTSNGYGGGGAGAVHYVPNAFLAAETYTVTVGAGAGRAAILGANAGYGLFMGYASAILNSSNQNGHFASGGVSSGYQNNSGAIFVASSGGASAAGISNNTSPWQREVGDIFGNSGGQGLPAYGGNGGGGGAGGGGGDASCGGYGGAGGVGVANSITGTSTYYGGGGGGQGSQHNNRYTVAWYGTGGTGGLGGGGNGYYYGTTTYSTAGGANTGGGGGDGTPDSSNTYQGSLGGSGIVIVVIG